MTQYDVELFQKIEALTGQKMEEFASEQEAVLLLLERIGEAQRISTMQVGMLNDCRPSVCPATRKRGSVSETVCCQ